MLIFIIAAMIGMALGFCLFAIINIGSKADERDRLLNSINHEREKK